MSTKSGHVDLAMYALKVFGNDGTIDMHELDALLCIALADGQIDDDERATLRNIFKKVPYWELAPEVRTRIDQLKEKYNI